MRKDGQNTFFSKWKYNQTKMLNGDNTAFTKDSDADQEVNRNHGCMIDGGHYFLVLSMCYGIFEP